MPWPARKIVSVFILLSWICCLAQDVRGAGLQVFPGDDLQAAIEKAAGLSNKVVEVHAGAYYPKERGQALIHLTRRHNGIQLRAMGEVILSAQNPKVADRSLENFPAVVNHVVYFGDGITRATVFSGFKITGANNFVTDAPSQDTIEPNIAAFDPQGGSYGRTFFFTDGGGIKIFGRSYPTIDGVEVYNNYSNPCGGGVSIDHRGYIKHSVLLTNCVFRNNRAAATGSGVDVLPGSAAEIKNCLFVGNISNTRTNYQVVRGNIPWVNPVVLATTFVYNETHGSGALTVFPQSYVEVDRCTFTGNFNGVDDRGLKSTYKNSIFWMNTATGGFRPGGRYELNVAQGEEVQNCFIHGNTNDLRNNIKAEVNRLDCPDPKFDGRFVPRNSGFEGVGYRPRGGGKLGD